jgi:hypothetical protein
MYGICRLSAVIDSWWNYNFKRRMYECSPNPDVIVRGVHYCLDLGDQPAAILARIILADGQMRIDLNLETMPY